MTRSENRIRGVDTRDPLAVAIQVRRDYRAMYPNGQEHFVPSIFSLAIDCFTGRNPEYQPIDARYHDLEHTLQGTLCLSSILRGRHQAGAKPVIPRRAFELCLAAILLHDTGYLKGRLDTVGTGAKYTVTHVQRSCEFAAHLLPDHGFTAQEISSIQNMIRCTGMGVNLEAIEFGSEAERICGYALGTADLLGQMAAQDYVEKLPVLYEEFAESGRFSGNDTPLFESAQDLLEKTPGFWEFYVLPRIDRDFGRLYQYLEQVGEEGQNEYLERIQDNLRTILAEVAPTG